MLYFISQLTVYVKKTYSVFIYTESKNVILCMANEDDDDDGGSKLFGRNEIFNDVI
jgi:hypothetical protein